MGSAKGGSGRLLFKNRPKFQFKNYKTYIFPTAFGFVFAFFSLILLFIALGYNNNLVYLFVFATISLSLSATYATNENVRKVRILGVQEAGDYFAGQPANLSLEVSNAAKGRAYHLTMESKELTGSLDVVESRSRAWHTIVWTPAKRGVVPEIHVHLASEFPFSLLHAWKVCRLSSKIYVFPKPHGDSEFPISSGVQNHLSESGLFRELRPYRDFDSIRRVDWRASQRHQSLLIRSFEDQKFVPQYIFTWESTAHLGGDIESRLSQLCLWICKAHKLEAQFCLLLPGFDSDWGEGLQHYKKCLIALSIFQPGDVESPQQSLSDSKDAVPTDPAGRAA